MRRFLPLLAIAALALALAATALAKPVHSQLTIKLQPDHSELRGALTSSKATCEKNAKVKLYWQQPQTSGFEKVASDETDDQGRWKIEGPGGDVIPAGKYYVTTAKSGKCPAATSDTLKVTSD